MAHKLRWEISNFKSGELLSEDRLEAVKVLLKDERVERNASDVNGNTALIVAAHLAPAEVVEVLLEDQRVERNASNVLGNSCLLYTSDAADE